MTRLLHLDASPRPGRAGTHDHGSHTRRLTHHFISHWHALESDAEVVYRDIGANPPQLTSVEWIEAEFTPAEQKSESMQAVLADSNALVDEVVQADILVLGVPMYNFGMPAAFKAWIDNIVRIGRTVDFDMKYGAHPYVPLEHYVPLLADRPRHAVLLSSRGGFGFDRPGPLADFNHLEPSVRTALQFIGIGGFHDIAIEHQEEGGEALAASTESALARIDRLVESLHSEMAMPRLSQPA
ncbi:NAD(P)H dehydrogenase (quinone) [Litchfieldella anticariensis FP35 = DSM 16096]|uniref:FMN dependent NADH:quinone oxidoreductase n=1 Tax=Litchfieldella anticariensis (strain DSM 16096 / CECT 5854 / CIP 108499 / LMG 22089 / FP35) TaxID=1121939 RepID=S2KRE7_LITA3|nr:NAD(P)H-dependent oxidoreductase [Halomonas anticariensis]EPC03073.1 NAD(P)H dehydrogenase (quinone) [Halomonas anticariensis FP35 = DSM 16096]